MSAPSDDPKPFKLKLSNSKHRTDLSDPTPSANADDRTGISHSDLPTPNARPERAKTIQLKNPPAQPEPTPPPVAPPPPLSPQVEQAPLPKPLELTAPPPSEQPRHGGNEDAANKPDQGARQDPSDSPAHNPLGSLLVVSILFLIVAAAAAGIWYLLQSDSAAPSNDVPTDASLSDPIQRAKQTIETLQGTKLDMESNRTTTAKELTNALVVDTNRIAVNLKDAVTQYLQSVHIRGVRTGSNARIMLNGEHYNINDIVDQATGLKFIGTRNQKLLFKDRNEIVYVKSF